MQTRQKFLFEFLLSVGLVFSLSQLLLTQTFFPEERLQSVAVIALGISTLFLLFAFLRYGFLMIQTRLNARCDSRDARSTHLRLPVSHENVTHTLAKFSPHWKAVAIDAEAGYARFHRPLNRNSWGQIIEIQYEPLDAEACWVEIKSSSIDYLSKNKATTNLENIRTAERLLRKVA